MLLNLLLYATGFFFVWFGAGLIISAVSNFSDKLKLSPFAFSFVMLGLLTSTPEFSVGLQSIADGNPQIFVGNLLGGVIVLFLVVIPLLAITGNGISLKHELDKKTLIATLAVISAPSIFILDKKITPLEGGLFVIIYIVLLYLVERKRGIFDRQNTEVLNRKAYSYKDLFKILTGLAIVFISSNLIVDKTLYFADFFNISAFYIGLLVIALGTDLPELSLALRSVITGKKDIAMGDYIGAASASTLMFGIFTVLNGKEIITESNFFITFMFISMALVMFYFVTRNNFISRREGFILFGLYLLFLFTEITKSF